MFVHKIINVKTTKRETLIELTGEIRTALSAMGAGSGILLISSPHTTAGITINENADPDVVTDMVSHLHKMVPDHPGFRHAEGNSDAHIKTALLGTCVQIPVILGKPLLGTWQGVYFCEFDGPRNRKVHCTFVGDNP
ncbi:secondary thiamine-phosphate synthase enzyme YjbQ [Myxococcota bacterium]|nr:secondary thiamine-phosphate synthase enzyme YjbQ [Myxococcota bacterium]MBU1537093.1 secondary thiamine-phosphate synthase enzyme YjbQ [Myxococcota bacterium]